MLSKNAWFFRQFLAFSILKANPTLCNLIIFFLVDKEENSFFRTVIITWLVIKNAILV